MKKYYSLGLVGLLVATILSPLQSVAAPTLRYQRTMPLQQAEASAVPEIRDWRFVVLPVESNETETSESASLPMLFTSQEVFVTGDSVEEEDVAELPSLPPLDASALLSQELSINSGFADNLSVNTLATDLGGSTLRLSEASSVATETSSETSEDLVAVSDGLVDSSVSVSETEGRLEKAFESDQEPVSATPEESVLVSEVTEKPIGTTAKTEPISEATPALVDLAKGPLSSAPVVDTRLETDEVESEPLPVIEATFVTDLYPEERLEEATLTSLAQEGLLEPSVFSEMVLTGRPQTVTDLETYFYTKLHQDDKLWEYFYKNLEKDGLIRHYFQQDAPIDWPIELQARSEKEEKRLKAHFYHTLQKDDYFRNYFYSGENGESVETSASAMAHGTRFFVNVNAFAEFPGRKGKTGKKPKAIKPAGRPATPYVPPVTVPNRTYTSPFVSKPSVAPSRSEYQPPVTVPNRTYTSPFVSKPSVPSGNSYRPPVTTIGRPSYTMPAKPVVTPKQPTGNDAIVKAGQGDTRAIAALTNQYQPTAGIGTSTRTQAQIRADNEELKTITLNMFGELSGVNDIKRLLTGKDPMTGEKSSRLMAAASLALNVVPVLKSAKLVDAVLDSVKLIQGIDRTTDTLKAGRLAFETVSVGKSAQVSALVAKGSDVADDLRRLRVGLFGTSRPVTALSQGLKVSDAAVDATKVTKTAQVSALVTKGGDVTVDASRTANATAKQLLKQGDDVVADVVRKPDFYVAPDGTAGKYIISSDAKPHLSNVEKVTKNRGVIGGHNSDEFYKALSNQGAPVNELIVSKKPHPTIEGIEDIKYRLPKKDPTGKVAYPPDYKIVRSSKTIYDPKVFSDDEMYTLGLQAMQNGTLTGKGDEIIGYASNGLKFMGYYRNGEITNFFPILP